MPDKEKYSFSKLTTFEQCKYQYYLNYIEKRKGEQNAFAQYGTFVHSLLEQHAKGELAVWELLDAYTDLYEESVTLPFPYNKYSDLSQSYHNDGYEFFKSFDGLDDLDIIEVEARFAEPLEDFLFTGVIDITYRDTDGGIVIRDWKSKSKFANKQELSKYSRQPLAYGLHIKNKFNVPPKMLQFFMFRRNEIVEIPFQESEYESALNWIKNTVTEIRGCKDFKANPNAFFCESLCDFRNTCEHKGGETERTLTAKKSTKPKKNLEIEQHK